jgi:hypothetical protein
MTTLELPWHDITLAGTHYYGDENDPQSCMVQWHTTAATLYILVKDKLEIDIRVEREVIDIQVSTDFH